MARKKKEGLTGQNGLSAAFLSLFSLHPSLSCERFQGLMVGEGERNSYFKFLLNLFVLLCKFLQTWDTTDEIGNL